MTERIRWEPTVEGDSQIGYVGMLESDVFLIWHANAGAGEWRLTSDLHGQNEYHLYRDGIDILKAEAERWLEEFVSSLGAVFPEAYEFSDDEDDEPLEVTFAAGRRVRYAHPDAGWPGEKEHAAEHLTLGEVYTIAWADIGQSRTDLNLYCCGVLAGRFNSVFFEPVDDRETAATAGEE